MIYKKHHNHQKFLYIVALLLSTGSLMACAKEEMIQPSDSRQITATEKTADADSFDRRAYGSAGSTSQETTSDTQTSTTTNGLSPEILADRKARFGQNCIAEQTFEVTLSEYGEKIFFVPFAPSDNNPEFHMELISDTGVLCEIPAYVPEGLAAGDFKSLDAVSFYDVNYDSHTDIVLIQTYGDRPYAAIYYGYPPEHLYASSDGKAAFDLQEWLSRQLSDLVSPLSIPEIRSFLSGGKKNGDFDSYQEAYTAVSKLDSFVSEATTYDLIYINDDEIPELSTGVSGSWVNLYTYHDGTVYILMDQWSYGAGGNHGYEYSPRKNSILNHNSDFAGAILYTTYMQITDRHTLEVSAQIKTYNFDDANGNDTLDESEFDSAERYSVSYLNGREISAEEAASFEMGDYIYIDPALDLANLYTQLKTNECNEK